MPLVDIIIFLIYCFPDFICPYFPLTLSFFRFLSRKSGALISMGMASVNLFTSFE